MIQVSESAISQVKRLQKEEDKLGYALRVQVITGGCSGMSYKLDFDNQIGENDRVFKPDPGVEIVIDPKSYLFVKGMHINFSAGLSGKGFEFHNPNASKSCGCGSSFSA